MTGESFSNSTNYNIDFTDKPTDTIDLPAFTQSDSFDLRIYGINSGTSPNCNYIYNVQLNETEAPGEVTVTTFEAFGKLRLM